MRHNEEATTRWTGHELFDLAGDKVGVIEDVRYGDVAGGLTWLVVRPHPLDAKRIFVPAGEVQHSGDRVIVRVPKVFLEHGVREYEDGFLSTEEEKRILRSYGLEYVPATMETDGGCAEPGIPEPAGAKPKR